MQHASDLGRGSRQGWRLAAILLSMGVIALLGPAVLRAQVRVLRLLFRSYQRGGHQPLRRRADPRDGAGRP